MLEIYAWSVLVLIAIGYPALIADIEWHWRALNLVIYCLIVGVFVTFGVIFLWRL